MLAAISFLYILTSMKRALQIGNGLSLIFALAANFLVATQQFNLPSIKAISDTYATLLTPAAYAFSIWSLIYLLLIVFVAYQARDIAKPREHNDLPQKIGPFFMVASVCNGLWTFVFVHELMGLSVALLLVLVGSLYILLWRLRIATYDAPLRIIACVWWPLMIYTGWVTVAAVANVFSWLKALGITVSPLATCVVLIGLAVGLLVLLAKRNVRELNLASIWGIFAIGVQQIHESKTVAATAFTVSSILLVAIAVHGYKNRRTNPFIHHT